MSEAWLPLWPMAGAAAVVTCAGLVRGFSGFGGALVMSPVLGLLFGPAPAVAMVLGIELAGYLQLLPATARHVRWRAIAPMAGAAVLAVPLGVALVVSLEPGLMRRIIGAIVVLLALLLLGGWRARARPGLPAALGVSAVSGLLEGLAGTPGPPVVLFLFAGPDSAAENRHNLIGYFVLLDLAGLALFAWNGVLSGVVLLRIAVLVPPSLLATWAGGRLFRRAGEKLLRRASLALVLAAGLAGLLY